MKTSIIIINKKKYFGTRKLMKITGTIYNSATLEYSQIKNLVETVHKNL